MNYPVEAVGPVSSDLYGAGFQYNVVIYKFSASTLNLEWTSEISVSFTTSTSVYLTGIGITSTEDKIYLLTHETTNHTHQIFEINAADGSLLRKNEFSSFYDIIRINRQSSVKMDASDNYLYLTYVGQSATPPIPNGVLL